ncbi:MAG TPA: mandelate racemase/muconate lactonizing enzyme family protein [Propionibacteriaceae bacterium]|nr:mandelate racemase/muconate lactonizing enzyme family protein [Propionibacteriaceae bacterium]
MSAVPERSESSAARVVDLRTSWHELALVRPWAADVLKVHVIGVQVTDSTGLVGSGLSWTPTIGAHAVRAMLDHDIRDAVLNGPVDPGTVWPRLWLRLHEAGSGGVTTIAMSGLDLALWDLAARRRGVSVPDLIGRRRETVDVYGSGVNLHYSLDELLAQVRRWVEAGYRAVKIKVGKPSLNEDCQRVAAVRAEIGPDVALMIDANQRWDLDQATTAMTALETFEPAWIEEPLLADDLPANAELRRRIRTPIALGENLHTFYRFRDAIDLGACDVLQPNVVRLGGITPFLRVATLAAERNVTLHPHLLPEISGQLALTLEKPVMVEDVEDASFSALGLLASPSPVVIEGGQLRTTGVTGLGLELHR